MDRSEKGPGGIPTGDRLKALGTAMMSSMKQKSGGHPEREQKGAGYSPTEPEAMALTDG